MITTVDLYGEPVEFLWNPDGPASDRKGSLNTAALLPYPGQNRTTYHLTQISGRIRLATADVDSATDACDDNVRTTIEMTIDSLEPNPATTFEENFPT